MQISTPDTLEKALTYINALDTTEKVETFLTNFYEAQPIVMAFLRGTFQKKLSEETYYFVVNISAQLCHVLAQDNPNMPPISQKNIEICFNKNLDLGIYLKTENSPTDMLEYVIVQHTHTFLLRWAFWHSTHFEEILKGNKKYTPTDNTGKNDFNKETYHKNTHFYIFIILKTIIEAGEMGIEN